MRFITTRSLSARQDIGFHMTLEILKLSQAVFAAMGFAVIGLGTVKTLDDLAISLPCVMSRHGIAHTLELPLSHDEDEGLKRSAQVIDEAIESLDLDERISLGKIPSVRLFLEQKEIV